MVPGLGFFWLFHYCGAGGDGEEEEDEGEEDGEGDKEEGEGKEEGGKEGKDNDREEGEGKDREEGGKKAGGNGSVGRRLESWVMGWMMEHGYEGVIDRKMDGFERWFGRKGWFGFEKRQREEEEEEDVKVGGEEDGKKSEDMGIGGEEGDGGEGEEERKEQVIKKWQQSGKDEKYRVLVDAALAYAITKALLPLRIIVSVQATPWFAGVLVRMRRVLRYGSRK